MRFEIYDEIARREWSKLLGHPVVGNVVYLSHDDYLKHRYQVIEIQERASQRKGSKVQEWR
jgi:hypothetical protein